MVGGIRHDRNIRRLVHYPWLLCAAIFREDKMSFPMKVTTDLMQTSNALDVQVGGDHYKKYKIQPVEYLAANGIEFMPGCAIKYLSRYRDKGGAEDVRKALHFCKLILELEYGEKP
jgi:hypothetical protein